MSDRIDELVHAVNKMTFTMADTWFDGSDVDASARFAAKDAVMETVTELATIARKAEVERKRGDFFRDALADACGCPPRPVEVACQEGGPCPFISDDYPDYAACWDEVERRQR